METSSFPINCVTPGSVFISRLQASISSLFKTRFSKKSCVFAGVHHIGGIFEDEIPVQRETLFSPVATFSRMGGNPDAFPSGSSVWFSSCSFLEMWTQAADRWGNHFSNTRYEAQTKVHLFYFSWRFPKEHPFSQQNCGLKREKRFRGLGLLHKRKRSPSYSSGCCCYLTNYHKT